MKKLLLLLGPCIPSPRASSLDGVGSSSKLRCNSYWIQQWLGHECGWWRPNKPLVAALAPQGLDVVATKNVVQLASVEAGQFVAGIAV